MAAERQAARHRSGQVGAGSRSPTSPLWMVGNLGHIAEVEVGGGRPPGARQRSLRRVSGATFPTADGERHLRGRDHTPQVARSGRGHRDRRRGRRDRGTRRRRPANRKERASRTATPSRARVGPWDRVAAAAGAGVDLRTPTRCAGAATRLSGSWWRRDPRCSEANPMFRRVEQPGIGSYLMPGLPIGFGGAAARRQAGAAPRRAHRPDPGRGPRPPRRRDREAPRRQGGGGPGLTPSRTHRRPGRRPEARGWRSGGLTTAPSNTITRAHCAPPRDPRTPAAPGRSSSLGHQRAQVELAAAVELEQQREVHRGFDVCRTSSP